MVFSTWLNCIKTGFLIVTVTTFINYLLISVICKVIEFEQGGSAINMLPRLVLCGKTCTLFTLHCTLPTVQCTPYNDRCTLYTVQIDSVCLCVLAIPAPGIGHVRLIGSFGGRYRHRRGYARILLRWEQ